jgi:IMP dehydrogenase
VVGIVTSRDLRFETRYDVKVSQIMTPREKLITVMKKTAPAPPKPRPAEQAQARTNPGGERRL